MSEGTTRPWLPASPWRGRQGLAALGVVVSLVVWRGRLLAGSFFNQDDYFLTSRAFAEDRLTWDYLFSPVDGHVMPARHATYWLVAHHFPFDWHTVSLLVLAVQVAATLVMWHLLSRLLPGRWVRVALLAVFAWSPSTLPSTLWWTPAMGLWPHVLFSLAAALCLVRAVQGVGVRGLNLAGCLLATCAGLLWQERSVLIPPMLLGVAVVMSPARGWRRITDALRRFWPLWVSVVALLVGYLVLHGRLTTVVGGSAPVRDYAGIGWSFLAESTLPRLLSGPWAGRLEGGAVVPATWVTVVSLALGVAVAVLLVRRGGRDARWALALVAAYCLADLALLLAGRSGFGRIIGLDPRYSADILPVAVIGVALALREGPPLLSRPDLSPAARGWRGLVAIGATAAYLAGAVVGTALLVPHFQNPQDREFWTRVRADLNRDPSQVIIDDLVPAGVLLPLLEEEALASSVFAPLPESPPFDQPSPRLRTLTPDGTLVQVELVLPTAMRNGPDGRCGYAVDHDVIRVPLRTAVDGRSVARVSYFTDTPVDMALQAGDHATRFRANAGPNDVWVVVPDQDASWQSVSFEVVSPGRSTVCVAGLVVGVPTQP